jgi:predicted Zn-dependent protease
LAAARGDSAAAQRNYRLFYETNPVGVNAEYSLRQNTTLERYDQVEKDVQPLLRSPRESELADGRWIWSIALRNQGRLEEAQAVARQHRAHDPNHLLEALVALDQGNGRKAVAIFDTLARRDGSEWTSAVRARVVTWNKTLYAMSLAAAGDTAKLRALADTVETWGQRSLYGRDRRAHHYVRGLLLVSEKRDAEAAEEFRQAIHSPTHGFTRINYELGKVLLRLHRPGEAVPVLQAALHGGIDGSNLYLTRTEVHELLAQAFDRLGSQDSARVHYGAVARAWAKSDPVYLARLNKAREWLVANPRSASSQQSR